MQNNSSTQLGLLIVDGNKSTLFRDGDLMFVTRDCVRAVIEVKTSLDTSSALEECAVKIAEVGGCADRTSNPFRGSACFLTRDH